MRGRQPETVHLARWVGKHPLLPQLARMAANRISLEVRVRVPPVAFPPLSQLVDTSKVESSRVAHSTTYDLPMWKRLREQFLSGFAIMLTTGWFACAILLAIWVVHVTGIEVRRKGFGGLVLMIFLVPVGIVVAIDEFVARPIKYGPPAPGRRKRGRADPDELLILDQRLRRRTGDQSES